MGPGFGCQEFVGRIARVGTRSSKLEDCAVVIGYNTIKDTERTSGTEECPTQEASNPQHRNHNIARALGQRSKELRDEGSWLTRPNRYQTPVCLRAEVLPVCRH